MWRVSQFIDQPPAGASALLEQPLLLPLPVALLDRVPLVMNLLAPRQRQLDLGPAAAVEIERQRDEREPLASDRSLQFGDLAGLEQQLAGTARLMVKAIAVTVLRN